MSQNCSYWNTEDSIKRYSQMDYKLTDVEMNYIFAAVQSLGKSVSDIKILDIGCGGGRTTIPLLKMGFFVKAIDIADNLVYELKKKVGDIVELGNAKKLNFPNESFDIVLFSHNSVDYLYPYSDRLIAFNEISRVLNFGGYFIFSSHVFNLIPYNIVILKNILYNFFKIYKIFVKGGYYDEFIGGETVRTYAVNKIGILKEELSKNNLKLLRYTKIIVNDNGFLKTILKALFGWERYYLVKKI